MRLECFIWDAFGSVARSVIVPIGSRGSNIIEVFLLEVRVWGLDFCLSLNNEITRIKPQ